MEVPEIHVVEVIKEIPQVQEVIREVPKYEFQEVVREIPKVEVRYVEKMVEVPQIMVGCSVVLFKHNLHNR